MSDKPLKLLVTLPADSDPSFSFQALLVKHLEKGLKLDKESDGKWSNDVGVTMEVLND